MTFTISISAVQLVYLCTDLYNVSTRYTSVPAFCCTLQECVLQEACMLSSNMVDFSMMEMNNLTMKTATYHVTWVCLWKEVRGRGHYSRFQGGWRRGGVVGYGGVERGWTCCLRQTVKHVQLNTSLCELTRNNCVSAPSETTSPCGLIRTSSHVTCILMHLPYFLDYFPQVLLISDHTHRYNMRAGIKRGWVQLTSA